MALSRTTLILFCLLIVKGVSSKYYGKSLGTFQNAIHQVEGSVYVANEDTFIITGFSYDGKGPDAHFWAGVDDKPSPYGFIVPDEHSSEDVLKSYDNAIIAIKLPGGKKVKDIKWLSVWCRKFAANFGEIIIPADLEVPRPKEIGNIPTFAHGVRSGPVEVKDAKTIYIPNLYYDGSAPDAFFLVGNGSSVTSDGAISVPHEGEADGHRIKQGFQGQSMTLTLPGDLTVLDIDWLSLYCKQYKENFGHVTFNKRDLSNIPAVIPSPTSSPRGSRGAKLPKYKGLKIGDFKDTNHNVRGTVYAINQNSFFIENFHYDGAAPDAFFWAGATASPDSGGFIVPNELGTNDKLRAYENRNIVITLPTGKTIRDIKWLGVWCRSFSENFGFVTIPDNFQAPREQEVGQIPTYAHGTKSGPVVIKDSKTIYISDLHYDGAAPDAFFLVGMGAKPHPRGIKVPDENGSLSKLKGYRGKDITLRLPGDTTVFDIDWFGLYCITYTENFGNIVIPKNLNVPADKQALMADNLQFDNCEEFFSGQMQAWWSVVGNDIYVQLQGKVSSDSSEYLSFGLSGDQSTSKMIGSDVVVAFYDRSTGMVKADDYMLTAKAQCSGTSGACPDTKLGGENNVELISYREKDGLLSVTYKRPLDSGDSQDQAIRPSEEQVVVAAIGGVNSNNEAAFHQKYYNKNTIKIKFGRSASVNCRSLFNDDDTDNEVGTKVDSMTGWPVFHIKDTDTFRAQIGPNGGKRGYQAITGIVPWGISYWINGMLIPEITVVRGRNYTFIVEGGDDATIRGSYHPLYITNSPQGGVGQTPTEIESPENKIYGGLRKDENGNFIPLGVGRLCSFDHKTVDQSEMVNSFDEFNRTLQLNCKPGKPGEFVFSPDENTPDLVYYQCFTHRNLGWKINVTNNVTTLSAIGVLSLLLIALMTNFRSIS